MEVQEPPLGRIYPILGYGCVSCQNLYHLYANLHPGYWSTASPWPRKSGLTGTKVGARIKPEPEPGLGLMADVPKLKGNSQSQSRMQGLIVWLSR